MMRILLGVTLILFNNEIDAQYSSIKIQPVSVFLNSISLSYEFSVSEKFILNTEISYLYYEGSSSEPTKPTFKGIGIELKPKVHLDSKVKLLRGWYISPAIGYGRLFETTNNTTSKTDGSVVSVTNFGGLLGYQWILFGELKGFAIDLNAGFNNFLFKATSGQAYIASLNGISPRIGLGIGYAF